MRMAQAPLVMLLNNDAYLTPDCLQKSVEAADRATWAGMFACKILQHDAPDRMDSAGIEVDRAGVAWNRGWGEPATRHTQALEVFGPSGAAALYRRAMLDQIGLLDDDFFAYYEDVDLAWRAQRAGWRCLYLPAAEVRHIHSATSGRGSAFKARLLGRNKWWTIAKNYPFASLWYYAPLLLAVDMAAAVTALMRDRNFSAVRGRWEALQGWRRMWRRRSEDTRAGAIDWRQKLCAVRLVR
jgi:GT2 family glycosyltransferase